MKHNLAALQRADAAHHLHPFTDNGELAAKGTRVIVRAEGVYLWDAEGRQLLDGQRLPRLVRDDPSPAQHHEAVPNGVSVVRGMGDEHHRGATIGRRAYVFQDTLGLAHAECRGGLVQDEDAGPEVERCRSRSWRL